MSEADKKWLEELEKYIKEYGIRYIHQSDIEELIRLVKELSKLREGGKT